jgi:hypothetical protein
MGTAAPSKPSFARTYDVGDDFASRADLTRVDR